MSAKPDTSVPGAETQALSREALERRRALLSGLGKGGAVLAAAVPIQSLAGSTVLTCKNDTGRTVRATVSGAQSAAASFAAGGGIVQVPACGKTPTYWCKSTSSWPCSKSTTFSSCFGSNPPGGTSTTTLYECMSNQTKYGANTAVWCAAYLNGMQYYLSGAGVFPYPHTTGTLKGVRAWYSDTQNAYALALFKKIQTQDS